MMKPEDADYKADIRADLRAAFASVAVRDAQSEADNAVRQNEIFRSRVIAAIYSQAGGTGWRVKLARVILKWLFEPAGEKAAKRLDHGQMARTRH